MKIPADAVIAPEKLANYLLAHRRKNDKSRYLLRAGFDQSNPEVLEAAIRKACAGGDAIAQRVSEYGTYLPVDWAGRYRAPGDARLAAPRRSRIQFRHTHPR